jgi:uncharacterized protein (DUF1800 family)
MDLVQRSLAALLCLLLMSPAAPGNALTPVASTDQPRPKARQAYRSDQLHGDDRILHALNRFTFGPRPGDLEAIRAQGLEKWFEQQLHPGILDQSDVGARLAQFPAMQRSPEDLLARFPSNAIIRQTMDGKLREPESGVLHAIYKNQMSRVAEKKQEQEQKKIAGQQAQKQPSMQGPLTMAGEMAPGMMSMGSAAAPAPTPLDPALIDSLLALAPSLRVARLAAMKQPELDGFFKSLKPAQRTALEAGLAPAVKEQVAALENPERLITDELTAQRLTRAIYSSAQLQEVMTDFWLNHFNVFLHKDEATPYYLVSYERDVIRPLALGKFEDLLEATAHSPAMLLYLDNASSTGPDSPSAERAREAALRRPGNAKKAAQGLNENYARELMELHTLGVNGGYTQADVTQVARIFTGWTVDRPQRGGGFQFDPSRHEPGAKKVLGKKIKEHGELEGRELLHMLATRPATAKFLSRELAVRFVSDDPPQSLVDRMAASYLSSHGDIAAVLNTLFHSPEFWSTHSYRAKVKTPIEYVASAVRASDAAIDNLRPLANTLRELGMPLYGCVPPTGYSWQSSNWVSTGALVARMNFALSLAANHLQGIKVTWGPQQDQGGAVVASLPGATIASPQAEESRLEPLLVPGGVSASTRTAVLEQFQQQIAQSPGRVTDKPVSALKSPDRVRATAALERQDQVLAGLLLGSPEFQRR